MKKPARITVLAAVGGGVVASVLTFGVSSDLALGASGNANPNSNSNANATPKPKSLVVSQTGSTPIAPGKSGTIAVKVSNPNNQPVILTDVTTVVSSIGTKSLPGLPKCDKSWIKIAPWSGSTEIKANGDTTVTLITSFDNKSTINQDNCKGVAYTFSFTATGRQA